MRATDRELYERKKLRRTIARLDRKSKRRRRPLMEKRCTVITGCGVHGPAASDVKVKPFGKTKSGSLILNIGAILRRRK